MPSDIMNLLHSIFVENYPQLPIKLLGEPESNGSYLMIDCIFCDINIYHVYERGYSWELLETFDIFEPDDGLDSDYNGERKKLDGCSFDPANPAWDPERMIEQIMHAFKRANQTIGGAWRQRRLEALNAATKDLEEAEAYTTRKHVT